MQTNKGRFKCKDEAQAVWNVFKAQVANRWFVEQFEIGSEHGALALDAFANDLHEARLIHGTIYDEDGRIEDKDVAHSFLIDFDACECWNLEEHLQDMIKNGKIRGTIFY
jgi:hypothetical protein